MHHRSIYMATLFVTLLAGPGTAGATTRIVSMDSVGPADQPSVQILRNDAGGTEMILEIPALVLETVTAGGQDFQSAALAEGGLEGSPGQPAIPVYSRLLAIPDQAGVIITATPLEEREISGVHLAPVQGETGDELAYDPAAYARDDFGSLTGASVGSPSICRDLRVVPVTFRPVQYNPSRGILKVCARMRVEVTYSGPEAPPALRSHRATIAPSFDRLYRSLVLNYDGPPSGTRIENGGWLLICANDVAVTSRLQTLINWRTRQGFSVRVATLAETGSTKEEIKAYIQNAYDNWAVPPEFVVLAGDAADSYSIPTWHETLSGAGGEGDHPYTLLAGDDVLSDVHIGRLSFNTLSELEVIVAKTVGYESTPFVGDPSWFNRGCLVGDPTHSGFSCIQVMQWIKTRLLQIGYTQVDTVFAEPFVNQMTTALNRGDTIFAYRGYIGMSGWGNGNTSALTNVNKLHFAVISTCGTGSFASGTSPSEVFLRAGTVAAPKAGIGSIGTATAGTHTRFNNCFTFGVEHGLLYEDLWEMGAAHTRGKYELFANYILSEPNYVTIFSYWNNLMGDPACPIWTGFPSPLTASFPISIPVGSNSFRMTVTEQGGRACAGAQVCLWKGTETYVIGATDGDGACELPVNAATPGTMKLTVTKHNRAPLLVDIGVTTSSQYVGYQSSAIDDDNSGGSQGNGDGCINPGETIELPVQLKNFGTQPAPDVSSMLYSGDPYVTIVNGSATFGTIAAGGSAWSAGPLSFTVSSACPQDHRFRFGLETRSGAIQWHSLIDLSAVSGDLDATGTTLYNSGNGRLDPGETLDLSVTLANQGGQDAVNPTAHLVALSPWVSVVDGAGAYDTIPAGSSGENTADHFIVRADPGTYQGHLAVFRLTTIFNGGACDTTYVSLGVGLCTSDDPVGPDRHGYYAFDSSDLSYPEVPLYNWLEINPSQGGGGGQISLGDYGDYQDKSRSMDLPFAFRFYGRSFTRVTVCSNGWLAMGDTYLTDYRNWIIPGAGAPQNLIAPFWDDLYESSSGHVYQRYDAANHLWVVEWSNMVLAYGGSAETFEVILYDPDYYPTTTGDGIIVFQYREVHNQDYGDNFATVGIQNDEQTDGLLYSFSSHYPAGAAPLAAGRAIKFVSEVLDVTSAPEEAFAASVPCLLPTRQNPFHKSTDISFVLAQAGPARLTIYDVRGRVLRCLINEPLAQGSHTITWTGVDELDRPVPSGVYFCRLEVGGRSLVRKVMKLE
jgi:hypothetical protein